MIKLWEFYRDCGHSGDLFGVFLATDEKIKSAIGKELYFAEVLGKRPAISCLLELEDLTLITDDQEFIARASDYNLLPAGINPLYYLPEDGDE